MNRESLKTTYVAIGLLVGVILLGITGLMIIEGYTFVDAFFMTMITISTVGFEQVHPLSPAGMYFTVFLIFVSFGIFAYAVTTITRYVVNGAFRYYYKNNRVKRKINRLKNHVVVCGFGRNGQQAVHELMEHGVNTVVVERNEDAMDEIIHIPDLLYVHGDATQDEVLESCQIATATALITTLPVDSDNLYVVLSARELNPKLTIISRASDEQSNRKLKRAGANNVIMPDKIGGQRMAKLVAQPDVVEFLDYLMLQSVENVTLEEIACDQLGERLNGMSIRELEICNDSGANVVGMKRNDGSFVINPLPEVVLSSNDKLFVLGTKRQIKSLMDNLIS